MKKIINGKRYDTTTATLVGEWSNGYNYSDFKHCEEELYRTPRGNWFTVGKGGPMSPYARSTGQNQWSGSANVFRPLTPTQAREWLELHGDPEDIERFFGSEIEDA